MSTTNPFPVGYQPAQIVYPPVMYPTVSMQNSGQNTQPMQQTQTSNVGQNTQPQIQPTYPPVVQPRGSNMLMVEGRHVVENWVLNKGETMVFFDRNKDVFYVKSVSEQGMPFPIEECTFKRKADSSETEETEQTAPIPSKYVTSEELNEKIDNLHKEIFELLSAKSNEKEVDNNGRQLIVR